MTKLWWQLFFTGMFPFLFGLENNWEDHSFLLGFSDVLFFQSSGKFGFGSLWLWVSPVEEVEASFDKEKEGFALMCQVRVDPAIVEELL